MAVANRDSPTTRASRHGTGGTAVVFVVASCGLALLVLAATRSSRGRDLGGPSTVGGLAEAVLCLDFSDLPSWNAASS